VRYYGIELHHDLARGSSRVAREELLRRSGAVRNLSTWISFHVTGEHKQVSNWGWRAPRPRAAIGEGGPGAIEILARYSHTWTDERLFDSAVGAGFGPADSRLPADYDGPTPGDGNAAAIAVLDGAHDVHEFTLGLSWTLNSLVRLQLNDVFLWAPEADRDGDGQSDNLLVSGANSSQANPSLKNRKTGWENAVMARLILKI
jgi:phosphate-selective porin